MITPQGTSTTSSADEFTYETTPTVTNVSPNYGPTTGGTSVTITGTGFLGATGAAGVKFGTNNATSYTVNSSTQITATSPAGSAGTVDITVTTPQGTSTTSSADQFTYETTPTVTNVSPNYGPTTGGTSVTITGTGFLGATGAAGVKFGTNNATSYTVNSSTQITATSPAGSAGTVDITVTTPQGTSTTSSADQFTYETTPTVTNVSPNYGPTTGGTSVTITGTSFLSATNVAFGLTSASFTINSDTEISATSPAESAGTVHITVTNPNGTSTTSSADEFTYDGTPTVTNVSPNYGPLAGGTLVTITGTGFLEATGTGPAAVLFGSTDAQSYTVVSDTEITATSPSGTGTVDITVTTPQGTSTINSADEFTYETTPTVTNVNPNGGPTSGGTSVTITGSGFLGTSAVLFGSNSASFTINSSTQITATAPAGSAGTVHITVTTPQGTSTTSSADEFTYYNAPTVTNVNPNAGSTSGGNSVVITGTSFIGTTSVFFGSNSASFTVNSSTQITATAPAGSGTVNVTVTNPGGTSPITAADQYTYFATPIVTGISPTSGSSAGGNSVVITGSNFSGILYVSFGANNAPSFTVNSSTQITATSPAGTPNTTVDVTVTNPGGTSTISSADEFTYETTPTVTNVSPELWANDW